MPMYILESIDKKIVESSLSRALFQLIPFERKMCFLSLIFAEHCIVKKLVFLARNYKAGMHISLLYSMF